MPSAGPDFVCIGLQKAGTRWLYDQLARTSGVWMPPVKELGFLNGTSFKQENLARVRRLTPLAAPGSRQEAFLREFRRAIALRRLTEVGRWVRGRPTLFFYRRMFALKGPDLSGDISPSYSAMDEPQIRAVAAALGDVRYVLLLRDPVSRLWSALDMAARRGTYRPEQLMRWETLRPVLDVSGRRRRSLPSDVWTRWRRWVPAGTLGYWFLDDVIERPDETRASVFRHVGVPDGAVTAAPANLNIKAKQRSLEMPDEVRVELHRWFGDEYERCADAFGGAALRWLERHRAIVSG